MAKGGRRKPVKHRKNFKKNTKDEAKILQRAKSKKTQFKKSKSLTKQMRGMKWDAEEYSEEFEEELDDQ